MRFKHRAKVDLGLVQINIAPLIDVIFQLLIFFMLSSSFTLQSGINVKLPRAITSDTVQEKDFVITITSEDVVYLNSKIVTLAELRDFLGKQTAGQRPVLIKSDRRSSMGRIVDVWDICRGLGIERINIATTQEK
jgi:biopolymer transport protein ExbD